MGYSAWKNGSESHDLECRTSEHNAVAEYVFKRQATPNVSSRLVAHLNFFEEVGFAELGVGEVFNH